MQKNGPIRRACGIVAVAAVALAAPWLAAAQNCARTSVGFTPLDDLGTGSYRGFQGGLYGGGTNTPPAAHLAAGVALAQAVTPRDAAGNPDAENGSIVLMSVGMSNTTQEFSTFVPLAMNDPQRHPRLLVVDAAQGGQDAVDIADPAAPYWSNVDARLAQNNATPAQVQAVWLKEAIRQSAIPDTAFAMDAIFLQEKLQAIVQIIKNRYPNTLLVYLSSRIYAGYATTALNPEPIAYQSGFAVRWLIEAQIAGAAALNYDPARGTVQAPWLAWGPYLWADGLLPRSDGLVWECSDFTSDGTHPSTTGRTKVAQMLLAFFKTDPTARVFFLGTVSDVAPPVADWGAVKALYRE
jgi:hypothetical protein